MSRPVREYRTASKENYEKFCKTYPSIKISFKKWREILYTCNYMFAEQGLETGDKIKLPWGFSEIYIHKKKRKITREWEGKKIINLAIDWKTSRQEGKKVYHMNYHSDGYSVKWRWAGHKCRLNTSSVWAFNAARTVKRAIPIYLAKKDKSYKDIYKEWK